MIKKFKREVYLFLTLLYSKLYKKRLVCFGTSLTEGSGWVSLLRKELKGWAVINSGKGGQNSNWGIDNFSKLVLRYKPTVALVEFAINDCYNGAHPFYEVPSLKDSMANMDVLFRALKRHNIKVYLLLMSPPFDKHCFGRNPYEERLSFELFHYSHIVEAKTQKIPIIDITSVWKKYEYDEKALDKYITDRLHPTEVASRDIIVPTILKHLEEK